MSSASPTLSPFHLAIQVADLDAARNFYGCVLGCPEGRSAEHWIDFDLFGHQLVTHLVADAKGGPAPTNSVDGQAVPVPHFGVVLTMPDWRQLAARLRGFEVSFVIEPQIRFEGLPGEQATMFLLDPSGNALEFKAFHDPRMLFATEELDPNDRTSAS